MSVKQNKTTGKWQVRYRDLQGAQRAKSFSHKKDALEFEAEVKLALRDGTLVSPSEKKATVGRLWADFIALKASKKLKTRIDYESIWRTHLEETWSQVPARKVSQVEFTKWVLSLGCSPHRVDKIHLLMTILIIEL